jgi:release factor glutamine methyltransferase
MATRREIFNQLVTVAGECYPEVEARQIAQMIITSRGGISRNDLLVEPNVELEISDLDNICRDLRRWRPVQYIIGYADFRDMNLEVRDGVLIPRPETEELVEWIATDTIEGASIFDIGTGSGAIAIALSREIKNSHVWAMDISHKALDVARCNGKRYAPSVTFVEGDALSDFSTLIDDKFDVIVSNPPYIPQADIVSMRKNVVDYEPATALFVPDNDPLIFYRSIAQTSKKILKEGGKLYFEIYELLATEMIDMLRDEGYSNIILREDFRGKPRMICATLQ